MAPIVIHQVSLQKGDRTATLQGLAHIAPKPFFTKVQAEIDLAKRSRNTIFFEKTVLANPLRPTSEEALLVRFITEAREKKALKTGWQLDSALSLGMHFNADATMTELAEQFKAVGIDFSRPWDEFASSLHQLLESPAGYGILVNYRNEVIVSRITAWCPKGDFLALYGQAHIAGIQRLLEQDGWGQAHWSIFDFIPEH